ncbi:MAG TPA: DNA primase [Candidatus Woesearchaeota archaeon]|nr:DNA primase [Candidatus Woesearchaeota archaeon]
MAKISQVSSKYIVHTTIEIDGIVDKPDVIGAIFGQTEGLLGADLELRELQRSGRIGRIEVNLETKSGKTSGSILIPSSLDKAETSIIGAALEVIQKIGPCSAKIKVQNIEDVRVSKRRFVIDRAKDLLKAMMDNVIPDSQELADEVAYSVRVMEIQEYGTDRLAAGPAIDESDEIIIVEGRADVLNMLKHGFKNVIAVNGTSAPKSIVDLCKKKISTLFVDGDRGGDLIIKEITSMAEIDYVAKALDGKEVEEITKKEIHKALRGRIAVEQAKLEIKETNGNTKSAKPRIQSVQKPKFSSRRPEQNKRFERPEQHSRPVKISAEEKKTFKDMLEDLIGTRGAYVLDAKLNILGKVPITELQTTIKSLKSGVHAIVFDGTIDRDLVRAAERTNVNYIIAMDSKIKNSDTKITILTSNDL